MKILISVVLIIILGGCVTTYDYITIENVVIGVDYETNEFQLPTSR